jgi:hypothetical protein
MTHDQKTKRSSILLTLLILTLLFQPVFAQPYDIMSIGELRGLGVTQIPTAYTGSSQGFQRISAAQYKDTGQTERNAALRMALIGVVKGSGGTRFNPGTPLNAIEGMIVVNRLMGNEPAVVGSIAAAIVGQSPANAQAKLYDAHAAQALALGITTAVEGQGYFKPITKELFYSWVARAIGLAPETVTPILDSAKDNRGIDPEHRGLIEGLLKERVIKLSNGALYPKSTVTRKEAVLVLDAVAPRFYATYGFTEQYGVVIGTKKTSSSLYGKALTEHSAVLRLEDGNLVQLQVRTGLKDGTDTEIATLRGGKVTGLSGLQIGDEARLLMSDATTVQIAEVLPTGSVLSRLKASLEIGEGIIKFVGNVEQIIPESQNSADTNKVGYRLRVRGVDGILNDILVLSDSKTGIKSDVIVTKGGVITYGNQYKVGNAITYYVKDGTEIIYLSLDQVGIQEVSGTLQKIEIDDLGKIVLTVYDYGNRLHSYVLSPNAALSINFRPALPEDLKAGSEVRLLAVDNVITRLTTESYIKSPGYIPPGSRIVFGQVQYIQGNNIYILDQSGSPYVVDSQTTLMKNGLRATIYTLKEGDQVKLYLSSLTDNTLFKVEIEGPEQLVSGVYKGTVKELKLSTNVLALTDPYALKNQEWVKETLPTIEVNLAKDVKIYRGGKPVLKTALNTLKGQSLYFVTRNAYGKQEISQIVIKGLNERVYSDTVKIFDPVISKLELSSKVNVSLPEGVIVLKDGRLVTQSAIIESDGIFVVGSSSLGLTEAALVEMIPSQKKPFDTLFAGSVDLVNSYAINFAQTYQSADFKWVDLGKTKYFISDDTVITDLTGAAPERLSRYNLFHGSYSKEDNKGTDGVGLTYERFYSFFVVSPGSQDIVGMVLRKKALIKDKPIDDTITSESSVDDKMEEGLSPLIYTRGIIEGFDVKWNRVKLKDAFDYTGYHGEWSPNRTSVYVELTGTMIVKGDTVISFSDLQVGDRVTIVRDDEDAIVLTVQE